MDLPDKPSGLSAGSSFLSLDFSEDRFALATLVIASSAPALTPDLLLFLRTVFCDVSVSGNWSFLKMYKFKTGLMQSTEANDSFHGPVVLS